MVKINDLISEYNGILDFVNKCAESGLEEFIEISERLSSFGAKLNDFLFSSLEEIAVLKKELNSQKLEADDIIQELKYKLKNLSASMSAADYKLCETACRSEYSTYWDLLEDESRQFLITSYFVMKKISSTKSDFSAVILCLCKPFENELRKKIYESFIIEQSKLPYIPKDRSKLREGIEYYQQHQTVYLPIKILLVNLAPPKYPISYQQRLHDELYNSGWDMQKITTKRFVDRSVDYMEKYRNIAAHTSVLGEQVAQSCKNETLKIMTHFLSAYPSKK